MLEIKDIEHLATLARIKLSDAEKAKFQKEIEPILGYVAKLKEITSVTGEEKQAGEHRNITRPDADVTETGTNTKKIVAGFPEHDGDYLKVKKIL
ncbi:MAG: Asp-tRNA(Asn)/Glu-tRNA(Gln) amidotransferase subunit GatC [Patescibacteria group bacterium]|nr:Asp-tRNA(Asn)/Glu-tRNA(Gln) amidotransferase subunit GatC [Patescibacteria group bacterium]MDE1945616.1 Asp-tRNA(Asn)/Glu-tRNA(Gln) amidotransferase subunit GatC [Patescibacteria group bacterium]